MFLYWIIWQLSAEPTRAKEMNDETLDLLARAINAAGKSQVCIAVLYWAAWNEGR